MRDDQRTTNRDAIAALRIRGLVCLHTGEGIRPGIESGIVQRVGDHSANGIAATVDAVAEVAVPGDLIRPPSTTAPARATRPPASATESTRPSAAGAAASTTAEVAATETGDRCPLTTTQAAFPHSHLFHSCAGKYIFLRNFLNAAADASGNQKGIPALGSACRRILRRGRNQGRQLCDIRTLIQAEILKSAAAAGRSALSGTRAQFQRPIFVEWLGRNDDRSFLRNEAKHLDFDLPLPGRQVRELEAARLARNRCQHFAVPRSGDGCAGDWLVRRPHQAGVRCGG